MIEVIPAIDIIGGRCVRLAEGDFSRETQYAESPVEIAKRYEQAGFRRLHLVDLDGAKTGAPVNLRILEQIAAATKLQIDFGGGLTDGEYIAAALQAGARQINLGTLAVKRPELFISAIERFGPEIVILSADVRGEIVQVRGWQEASRLTIEELVRAFLPAGLLYITCTDISRDGMMAGPAVELYQRLSSDYPQLQITASGGVRNAADVRSLAVAGASSVIIGKALLSGALPLKELQEFIDAR